MCKDLAKNPRIPPMIAMQALISQQTKIPSSDLIIEESEIINPSQIILHYDKTDSFLEEKQDMRQPWENGTESEGIGDIVQGNEGSDVKVSLAIMS